MIVLKVLSSKSIQLGGIAFAKTFYSKRNSAHCAVAHELQCPCVGFHFIIQLTLMISGGYRVSSLFSRCYPFDLH